MSHEELVFIPLGGVGEIGMNMGLYGYGPARDRTWLIVDCGITFPGPELPGVEVIYPDIRFLVEEVKNIAGMVITHAHEDHYGAVLGLWPKLQCQVYTTPFTARMLSAKRQSNGYEYSVPVTEIEPDNSVQIGDFHVEFVSVAHSIPESCALYITTPAGNVLHTGDWKLDDAPVGSNPTNVKRLKEIGEIGNVALVCDSTNATKDGSSPTESEVGEELARIIAQAPNRVAVTIFASNVGRMISIARAAQDAGRSVVAAGRSIHRVAAIAKELGLFEGLADFLDQDGFTHLSRENCLVLCTGSQGESRAAMARIASQSHPHIKLARGDMAIFSSSAIPGNEREIYDIHNQLVDQGIELVTNHDALVHVTGHPRRDELAKLYSWIKPSVLVPVHGEPVHLTKQANLARDKGISNVVEIRNGDMAKLFPQPGVVKQEVPTGMLLNDGKLVLEVAESGVRERRKLSFAGQISVSIMLSKAYELADEPYISAYGLPEFTSEGEEFADLIYDALESCLAGFPRKRRRDTAALAESIRRSIRSQVNNEWGKKPFTDVFIHRQ